MMILADHRPHRTVFDEQAAKHLDVLRTGIDIRLERLEAKAGWPFLCNSDAVSRWSLVCMHFRYRFRP